MQWVDHDTYFGPNRRRKLGGMRLREHRRYDIAANPPPLVTALRQLRMRVLDARGAGANAFLERVKIVALLAQMNQEHETAATLVRLAATLAGARGADVRPALYDGLGRANASLRQL